MQHLCDHILMFFGVMFCFGFGFVLKLGIDIVYASRFGTTFKRITSFLPLGFTVLVFFVFFPFVWEMMTFDGDYMEFAQKMRSSGNVVSGEK